jgi:hypothetical protein
VRKEDKATPSHDGRPASHLNDSPDISPRDVSPYDVSPDVASYDG